MVHTTIHSSRAISKSRRGVAVSKRKASSTVTKAGRIHRAKEARPAIAKSQQLPKAALRKIGARRAGRTAAKGVQRRTGSSVLNARMGTRGQRAVALEVINKKKAVQARKRKNVVKRGRPRVTAARSPKITTYSRSSRRSHVAPRLFRCNSCGNLVPWVSVDSRCFPCLKRGLAARKREEEMAFGAFDIDEDFVAAVR